MHTRHLSQNVSFWAKLEMNYYKHATTELQAALQRLVHMPSHMYVHSHSPLSRGSTSRTDVPGGVRVSRAVRAKPSPETT